MDFFSLENLHPYVKSKKKKKEKKKKKVVVAVVGVAKKDMSKSGEYGFLECNRVLEIRFSHLMSQKNKKKPQRFNDLSKVLQLI